MSNQMDGRRFIGTIKKVVRDAAIEDTIDVLEVPPGRSPSVDLLKQSHWYRSLSPEDQRILTDIIANAVNRGIFGLLCVLDGVRAVEDGEIKGDFELNYIKNGTTLLNAIDTPMLHDLYNDPEV